MAAPPPLFSDLYNLPAKWDEPTPDYAALILRLGGTAATGGTPAIFDRRQTMTGLANLARRSPTLIAFCPADDIDLFNLVCPLFLLNSCFNTRRVGEQWSVLTSAPIHTTRQPIGNNDFQLDDDGQCTHSCHLITVSHPRYETRTIINNKYSVSSPQDYFRDVMQR